MKNFLKMSLLSLLISLGSLSNLNAGLLIGGASTWYFFADDYNPFGAAGVLLGGALATWGSFNFASNPANGIYLIVLDENTEKDRLNLDGLDESEVNAIIEMRQNGVEEESLINIVRDLIAFKKIN
jgi:hypothetical protein